MERMSEVSTVCVLGPVEAGREAVRLLSRQDVFAVHRGWDDFRDSDASRLPPEVDSLILLASPEPGATPEQALHDTLRSVFHAGVAASQGNVRRIVVASDLGFFRRCPSNWRVDPRWAPRPAPEVAELLPYLVENSVRELIRETGVRGIVVRAADPGAHITEEGVAALADALKVDSGYWWQIRHHGQRPAAPVDQRDWRTVLAAPDPVASRPIRNVVVFGAGGPMAGALFPRLRDRYRLRLTDRRPLAEIRAAGYPHQPPGSPLPEVPEAPHEEMHCDVSDPDQVMAACEGMDVIINCSVIRYTEHDHAVNMLGCWNIARAAAKRRIRRVVQTGPQMTHLDPLVGYHSDYDSPGNAAPRPGRNLYGHTKYLGAETLKVFAHWYDLEVPVLVFNGFVTAQSRGENAFETTFEESADAIVKALEVPRLPSPWELVTVNNDLPYGRNSPQRAWEVLGWKTIQFLEDTWRD